MSKLIIERDALRRDTDIVEINFDISLNGKADSKVTEKVVNKKDNRLQVSRVGDRLVGVFTDNINKENAADMFVILTYRSDIIKELDRYARETSKNVDNAIAYNALKFMFIGAMFASVDKSVVSQFPMDIGDGGYEAGISSVMIARNLHQSGTNARDLAKSVNCIAGTVGAAEGAIMGAAAAKTAGIAGIAGTNAALAGAGAVVVDTTAVVVGETAVAGTTAAIGTTALVTTGAAAAEAGTALATVGSAAVTTAGAATSGGVLATVGTVAAAAAPVVLPCVVAAAGLAAMTAICTTITSKKLVSAAGGVEALTGYRNIVTHNNIGTYVDKNGLEFHEIWRELDNAAHNCSAHDIFDLEEKIAVLL